MATVVFLGKLRSVTGTATDEIEASGVGQALEEITDKFGGELSELIYTEGNGNEPSGDIYILVNGKNIDFINGTDTDLKPEDRITILYHGARGYPGG